MNQKGSTSVREKINPKTVHLACISFLFIGLLMIIGTTYNIHLFLQEPKVVTGKLGGVSWYNRGIAVEVNGSRYVVEKEVYSKRSFGIIENKKLGDLLSILQHRLGMKVQIEYVDMTSTYRHVLRLTIKDVDYVEKDGALNDCIGIEKTMRCVGIVLLAFSVAVFVIARKYSLW